MAKFYFYYFKNYTINTFISLLFFYLLLFLINSNDTLCMMNETNTNNNNITMSNDLEKLDNLLNKCNNYKKIQLKIINNNQEITELNQAKANNLDAKLKYNYITNITNTPYSENITKNITHQTNGILSDNIFNKMIKETLEIIQGLRMNETKLEMFKTLLAQKQKILKYSMFTMSTFTIIYMLYRYGVFNSLFNTVGKNITSNIIKEIKVSANDLTYTNERNIPEKVMNKLIDTSERLTKNVITTIASTWLGSVVLKQAPKYVSAIIKIFKK